MQLPCGGPGPIPAAGTLLPQPAALAGGRLHLGSRGGCAVKGRCVGVSSLGVHHKCPQWGLRTSEVGCLGSKARGPESRPPSQGHAPARVGPTPGPQEPVGRAGRWLVGTGRAVWMEGLLWPLRVWSHWALSFPSGAGVWFRRPACPSGRASSVGFQEEPLGPTLAGLAPREQEPGQGVCTRVWVWAVTARSQ